MAEREVVTYEQVDGIARVGLDDGKANVLGPPVLFALDAAFDRARAEDAAVLLTGRDGVLSGGFDLGVLSGGAYAAMSMVRAGFELAARILIHPRPVVVACTGHAIAMGSFLLLAADARVGATAGHRIAANEVSIGLTMPLPALELLRARLTPAAFERATLLSVAFEGPDALTAGWLDELVAPDRVIARAEEVIFAAAALDAAAFRRTKARVRADLHQRVRAAIVEEFDALRPAV